MRLQTEELEQAMDGALGNPGLFGDGTHAPVCCGLGLARECLGDQLGHRLVLDCTGPAGTHLVVEPLDPIGDEAIAPFADRMGADAKPRRHNSVARLTLAGQHNLRPQRQCRRQRTRARDRRQMRPLVARHCQHRFWPSGSHRVSPSIRIPETYAIFMLRTYGTEH